MMHCTLWLDLADQPFLSSSERLGLSRDPSKYRITSMSGTWDVDGMDDKADWQAVSVRGQGAVWLGVGDTACL